MKKYQPYSENAKSILRGKRPLPEGFILPAAGFGIARASGSVCYVRRRAATRCWRRAWLSR